MKKIISLMFILAMILTMGAKAMASEGVIVTLDGTQIIFPDAQPFVDKRDRTLVPIRFVSEALGAEVSWDNESKTAIIVKGNDTIKYTIGNLKAYRNDNMIVFDTYGILKEDRTFVPLRYISEILDCNVEWNTDSNSVIITSPTEAVDFPEPKVTVNYPTTKDDKKLFWITIDNYRDFERNCPNYEFKIDFINPSEFNAFEQDEGAINRWQKYDRNSFKKLTVSGNSVVSVIRNTYTTRADMKSFVPYEGMDISFKLTVLRKCSGEERTYSFTEKLKMSYGLEE